MATGHVQGELTLLTHRFSHGMIMPFQTLGCDNSHRDRLPSVTSDLQRAGVTLACFPMDYSVMSGLVGTFFIMKPLFLLGNNKLWHVYVIVIVRSYNDFGITCCN